MICRNPLRRALLLAIFAAVALRCAGTVRPTPMPVGMPSSALWVQPVNLSDQNLFDGPWGANHAPDRGATYTFIRPKTNGVNPGVIVRDPLGRTWHVKQAPPHGNRGDEGPVEVVLSRVLSALGYHQPPVYYVPSFVMRDGSGTHVVPGGRFRLDDPAVMKARGEWSWQQNPYVGQPSYQGLLVIMLIFNSSDLKNSNNSLYDVTQNGHTETWYVVRDLGSALGETARLTPHRNNIVEFARAGFITGVSGGFVGFDFHALHSELIRNRITPNDVDWATALIGGLSQRQWQDAFRAGGYAPDTAARYIDILHRRIAQGQRLGDGLATTQ